MTRSQADIVAELVEIVSEVLETGPVDADDDLLSLGADSLSLTALSGRIAERWEVLMTFADLMRHPGVSSVAQTIEQRLRAREEATAGTAAPVCDGVDAGRADSPLATAGR